VNGFPSWDAVGYGDSISATPSVYWWQEARAPECAPELLSAGLVSVRSARPARAAGAAGAGPAAGGCLGQAVLPAAGPSSGRAGRPGQHAATAVWGRRAWRVWDTLSQPGAADAGWSPPRLLWDSPWRSQGLAQARAHRAAHIACRCWPRPHIRTGFLALHSCPKLTIPEPRAPRAGAVQDLHAHRLSVAAQLPDLQGDVRLLGQQQPQHAGAAPCRTRAACSCVCIFRVMVGCQGRARAQGQLQAVTCWLARQAARPTPHARHAPLSRQPAPRCVAPGARMPARRGGDGRPGPRRSTPWRASTSCRSGRRPRTRSASGCRSPRSARSTGDVRPRPRPPARRAAAAPQRARRVWRAKHAMRATCSKLEAELCEPAAPAQCACDAA